MQSWSVLLCLLSLSLSPLLSFSLSSVVTLVWTGKGCLFGAWLLETMTMGLTIQESGFSPQAHLHNPILYSHLWWPIPGPFFLGPRPIIIAWVSLPSPFFEVQGLLLLHGYHFQAHFWSPYYYYYYYYY